MKGICLIVLLITSLTPYAQTWSEWFQQKKTQIQYLTQQVAGLQMYSDYLSKGYKIAKSGLQTVGNLKNGELNLHQIFISSLSKINPAVAKDARIAAIIGFQVSISQQYHTCLSGALGNETISKGERGYIRSVFMELLDGCSKDVDDLLSVTTDDQLLMSDNERLRRLETIYQNMKDRHQFTQSFYHKLNELSASRVNAQNEINRTKALFNLK